MISEGSCDTEDWSNDAENSALITEINYNKNTWRFRPQIALFSENDLYEQHDFFSFALSNCVGKGTSPAPGLDFMNISYHIPAVLNWQ